MLTIKVSDVEDIKIEKLLKYISRSLLDY